MCGRVLFVLQAAEGGSCGFPSDVTYLYTSYMGRSTIFLMRCNAMPLRQAYPVQDDITLPLTISMLFTCLPYCSPHCRS